MTDEFNPNHPVTAKLRGQWHKLLAVVIHKYGEVTITSADIESLNATYPGMQGIVVHDSADGLHIWLVDEAEGRRLARDEGGLPV